MSVSLLLNGQVRVGGVESAYVEVSEFRRAYFLQSHPCQCKSLVDTDKVGNEGVLIGELAHGTIEWALEAYKGADKVRVPLSIIAARGIDGSIICIYPDCVCRALQKFANMAPSDSKRALVNVVFVDDNRYNPRSHRDSEKLRALAAKYCAMSDDARLDALIPVIEDTVVMLALNNGELREKITNWLKPGVPGDVPPEVTGALIDALNIGRRSATRALKHIYVTRRAYILDKLRPVISTSSQGEQEIKDANQGTADTGQQATAIIEAKSAEGSEVKDAKAEVKENAGRKEEGGGDKQSVVIPCAEASKTELIYDIFRELGIQLDERGAEVGYLLCADFTAHELRAILNKVGSIKSLPSSEQGERLNEVRKLLFSLDEDEIRAYFGLAVKAEPGKAEGGVAGSVEYVPPEEEASRAGEDLVRAASAYRDALERAREANSRERDRAAERVRDAETGMLNSYARVHEALFRALFNNEQKAHELAVKYAGLFRFTLPNPYVVDDLAELTKNLDAGRLMKIIDTAKHVETRCRELGINCGGLWDAVKGAIDHVGEAMRHVREYQGVVGGNGDKGSRSDVLAEEVRATAEEVVSEVCLGIEEIRDAILDIVYNAILDKNLANTVREVLGKVVITRCGAF